MIQSKVCWVPLYRASFQSLCLSLTLSPCPAHDPKGERNTTPPKSTPRGPFFTPSIFAKWLILQPMHDLCNYVTKILIIYFCNFIIVPLAVMPVRNRCLIFSPICAKYTYKIRAHANTRLTYLIQKDLHSDLIQSSGNYIVARP